MKLAMIAVAVGAFGCTSNDGPPTCLPGCTGARDYDAVSYDLHASFDWSAQQLSATEDVTLGLGSGGAVVELDSAVTVTRVHAGDQDLAYAASPTANTLTIDLTPLASPASFSIDYTAIPATSLIATASRDDDPVTSRVVYTDSEPDRALYWLVTKLDPSDRALWSVDVTVDPDEDVIANGARISDQMANGKRVVAYALDKPIPPYLMAFAAGQLDHTDRTDGPVPLSVWYRHGLVLDPNATLDAVADAMTTFDNVIMPYPWDTYSVVLLPYGGGMENATITFNNETSGQGNVDFVLNAHELSHHWFGDWVTMHTYDDVWFKEGMATVLESEAERARRDGEAKGRLWGIDYAYTPADAIVDDSLHGLDKYTSGPYERAAWLITQIRSTVGETAFWAGLRAMLAAHELDSVTGEQFIRSFQPALDEPTVQKLLAALLAHGTPTITASPTSSATDTSVALELDDPDGTMIAPIDITVVDATGAATTSELAPGSPITVVVPVGGYFAPDERDVHPSWTTNFNSTFIYDDGQLFAPATTAAPAVLAAYTSRSAAVQERSEYAGALPIADPSQFAAFSASLDSIDAQNAAVIAACYQATQTANPAWIVAAEPQIEMPARPTADPGFAYCGTTYSISNLEAELASALATATPASLARVEYLLSFDYGADAIAAIGPVVTSAPTLMLRDLALERLYYQVDGESAYSTVTADQLPAWDALVESRFNATMSEARFDIALELVVALDDLHALPLIAPLLGQVTLGTDSQVYAVCSAYKLDGPGAAWTAFQAAAMPTDPVAAADLQNPSQCGGEALRAHVRGRLSHIRATRAPASRQVE